MMDAFGEDAALEIFFREFRRIAGREPVADHDFDPIIFSEDICAGREYFARRGRQAALDALKYDA